MFDECTGRVSYTSPTRPGYDIRLTIEVLHDAFGVFFQLGEMRPNLSVEHGAVDTLPLTHRFLELLVVDVHHRLHHGDGKVRLGHDEAVGVVVGGVEGDFGSGIGRNILPLEVHQISLDPRPKQHGGLVVLVFSNRVKSRRGKNPHGNLQAFEPVGKSSELNLPLL
jgi:hypothetical protein